MAAKWPSAEAEYVQSPDRPTLPAIAKKWKKSHSQIMKDSAAGNWKQRREEFSRKVEEKVTEKTEAVIERVAEKQADGLEAVIERQMKNYRGSLSTMIEGMKQVQAEIVRRRGTEDMQAVGMSDLLLAARRLSDGIDKATRGERVVLGLDKADRDDTPPPITVQVLQVAMADPEMRRLLQELSFRMGEAGK